MEMWMFDVQRLLDGSCLDGIEGEKEKKSRSKSCYCNIVIASQFLKRLCGSVAPSLCHNFHLVEIGVHRPAVAESELCKALGLEGSCAPVRCYLSWRLPCST